MKRAAELAEFLLYLMHAALWFTLAVALTYGLSR